MTEGRKSFSYPVFLSLADRAVLVVGGGPVATRKAEGLIAAGAQVTVVATALGAEVRALDPPAFRLIEQPYHPDVLTQVSPTLVFTATDDPQVNAAVAADATAAGIWVNSADDPANCGFILPAIHRQGDIVVAVSSGGSAPALAQYARDRIAQLIGPAYARAARTLRARRAEIQGRGESTEGRDWLPDIEDALGD